MKIKILSIICLVFSLSSCNGWLDIDLANKVDEGKLFSTEQGFNEALAGVYSQLASVNLYGKRLTYEYIDLYAQYYSSSSSSSIDYDKHFAFDYTNVNVKSVHAAMWSGLYSSISGVNNILNWADKNASVLSEASRNQIRGEAIALRAFLHFDIYRLFSPDVKREPKANGIPYNKVFGVSLPPMYTVEETIQLVINDLLEAEKLLANDPIVEIIPYMQSTKNQADKLVARMNLYSVKAMLARAYQARGEGDNAIKYAKEVIECGKFRLLDFVDINKDESSIDVLFSDEHIFSLRNKDLDDVTHKLFYDIKNEGTTTLAKLVFENLSVKYEGNNDDVRYTKWFNVSSEYKKYEMKNKDIFFPKVPMIKLSEMYLIIAECSYVSNPDQALQYINTLRDHRITNNSPWSFITRNYVVEEMAREYLGEGQLWYAYKRNNMPITDQTTGKEIPASNDFYVFPMPDKEIESGNRY